MTTRDTWTAVMAMAGVLVSGAMFAVIAVISEKHGGKR